MNNRTTHRDLETELHRFVQANRDAMAEETVALLIDVHSLLVHRTGRSRAIARQRDVMGAALRDSVTGFHALRVVYGDMPATEMVPTIQKQLDIVAAEVRVVGGLLALEDEEG